MSSKKGAGCIMQMEKGNAKGKCRKWCLRIACGYDPYTGRYKEKTRVFNGSYSDAQKALREFTDEIEAGRIIENNDWILEKYAEHYFNMREMSGNLSLGSIRRDRDRINSLCYLIGVVRLQRLTPMVLEQAYVDLRNGKSKSGKTLSGTYVFKIYKALSCMLKDAVVKGIIASNPCDKANPPKMDTKEKHALSPEEAKSLISKLDPTHHGQLGIMLCLMLGLRCGEAVGLSWDDIDFDENTVYVRHSYDDAGVLNTPKTKPSFRILPLPDLLRNALLLRQAYLIKTFEKRCLELFAYDDDGKMIGFVLETPVFCSDFGVRTKPAGFDHWWRKHRDGFKMSGITLHELRHSFLTLAAKQGVHPSIMQKLAGHSNAQVTIEIYTHVNLDAKRDAMQSLQAIF